MELTVNFTLQEKISFLKGIGYTVKRQKEIMSWPVYHNDVEEEECEVWAVYKKNKPYNRPVRRDFSEEHWLDEVFQEEIGKKLKGILLMGIFDGHE